MHADERKFSATHSYPRMYLPKPVAIVNLLLPFVVKSAPSAGLKRSICTAAAPLATHRSNGSRCVEFISEDLTPAISIAQLSP